MKKTIILGTIFSSIIFGQSGGSYPSGGEACNTVLARKAEAELCGYRRVVVDCGNEPVIQPDYSSINIDKNLPIFDREPFEENLCVYYSATKDRFNVELWFGSPAIEKTVSCSCKQYRKYMP